MPRDLAAMAAARHDLLVIGGGIHGLFAAYDAAARGLRVALVERGDFGGALSANHQRTIHGGLRAIEHGQLHKARQQVTERRTWARIAPHLIRPLPFLVGTYRFTRRSRLAIRAGFAAYDLVGRARNEGIAPELHLPRTRLESVTTTRRLFPGVADRGLTGGAVWYDYQVLHPDRLNWTVALAARRAGAQLANYAEAIGPVMQGDRIGGARVRDLETGADHEIQAAATLLAAGGDLGPLLGAFGATGAPPLLRAVNLLVAQPARDLALGARGASGRMWTRVPWQGLALVGTYQSEEPVAANAGPPPRAWLDAALSDANSAFPALHASWTDVRIVHHGLTPAVVRRGRADLLPDPIVRHHAAEGRPGLHSLVGVKFTTARRAAEAAIDAVSRDVMPSARPCTTGETELPFAGVADAEGRLIEALRKHHADLDPDVAAHLTAWYGTETPEVVDFAAAHGGFERVSAGAPVLAAEIAYAAARADAVRLGDAVLRRTPLGSAGHPGPEALARAAAVMARVSGWSAERRTAEVAAVDATYLNLRA